MQWSSSNRRFVWSNGPGDNGAGCSNRISRQRLCSGLAGFNWSTLTQCGYVLAAEVLGVILLIVLCAIAANKATEMNNAIEDAALAQLAFSDPSALCVNATDHLKAMKYSPNIVLQLVPEVLQDSDGVTWKRPSFMDDVSLARPLDIFPKGPMEAGGVFSFAVQECQSCDTDGAQCWKSVAFTENDWGDSAFFKAPRGGVELRFATTTSVASSLFTASADFTRSTVAAMYHCGIITGGYNLEDLSRFVSRHCAQCDPGVADDKQHPLDTAWMASNDVTRARSKPTMEEIAIGYNASVQVDPGQRNTSECNQGPHNVLADHVNVLTFSDQVTFLDMLLGSNNTHTEAYTAASYKPWREFNVNESFCPGLAMSDTDCQITTLPIEVQPLTYHVSVPSPFLSDPVSAIPTYSSWLQLAQQSPATAECMASTAKMAMHVLESFKWYIFSYSNGTRSLKQLVPVDSNATSKQLYVVPDLYGKQGQPYVCADGVDITSSDSIMYSNKLAAYRASAKSQCRATLFGSMQEQTYDDVYAVYTGVLGALFGAMTLVVTTLFVYATTLSYYLLRGCTKRGGSDVGLGDVHA